VAPDEGPVGARTQNNGPHVKAAQRAVGALVAAERELEETAGSRAFAQQVEKSWRADPLRRGRGTERSGARKKTAEPGAHALAPDLVSPKTKGVLPKSNSWFAPAPPR